jgi:predicted amidophosphoribosyltransferase
VNHIFLIEWHTRHSNFFDQLVYRLKSDNSIPALLFYTDLLAELVQSTLNTSDFDALVPIAGSKASSVHARIIADRLSLHFSLPVLDAIKKHPSEKAQKYMTAAERRQKNLFTLNEEVYEEFTKKRLISNEKPPRFLLVDDILTTGISFQHGASVLRGSEHNMIATLFYRPLVDVRVKSS